MYTCKFEERGGEKSSQQRTFETLFGIHWSLGCKSCLVRFVKLMGTEVNTIAWVILNLQFHPFS